MAGTTRNGTAARRSESRSQGHLPHTRLSLSCSSCSSLPRPSQLQRQCDFIPPLSTIEQTPHRCQSSHRPFIRHAIIPRSPPRRRMPVTNPAGPTRTVWSDPKQKVITYKNMAFIDKNTIMLTHGYMAQTCPHEGKGCKDRATLQPSRSRGTGYIVTQRLPWGSPWPSSSWQSLV